MAEDLHTKKASHVSFPMTYDAEYHFSNPEMAFTPKIDKTYMMCTPVICTSIEPGAKTGTARFKQISKPYVEDRSVFDPGRKKQSIRQGMAMKMGKK